MNTNKKIVLPVQRVGTTKTGTPYYFIKAKDNDPALIKFLELQNTYFAEQGMPALEKNKVSDLYPYFSAGKDKGSRNFGNNGFLELVTLEDGREMFLPDLTAIKRIKADAIEIADGIIAAMVDAGEPEPTTMQRFQMIEQEKQNLINQRTGKRYEYPAVKSAPVVDADESIDMEDVE